MKQTKRTQPVRGIFLDVGDTLIIEEEGKSLSDMAGHLVTGAKDFLRDFAPRIEFTIVSNTVNSRQPEMEQVLTKLGLINYISYIVTSLDLGIEKPDPGIFREACRVSGKRPEEVVMIGDRVDTDILGANRAGIRSILLRWRTRHPMNMLSPEHTPTFTTASFVEIRRIIQSLS